VPSRVAKSLSPHGESGTRKEPIVNRERARAFALVLALAMSSPALAQQDLLTALGKWTGLGGILDPLLAIVWFVLVTMLDGFGWLF
jgi:hypothetical protein